MKTRFLIMFVMMIIYSSILAFLLTGCGNEGSQPPWPTDYNVVFSRFIPDPADDLVMLWPWEQPSYPVNYPPVDVTQVSLGVQDQYFYIRIDYLGVIPTAPVDIPENPPVEAQIVGEQSTDITMDIDKDSMTGGPGGEEVLYQMRIVYGREIVVWAGYNPVPGTDNYQGFFQGEFGEGGPGHNYIIGRFNLDKLGSIFPKGVNVLVNSWSEAASFDESGKEFYHHFAFDTLNITNLTLPE